MEVFGSAGSEALLDDLTASSVIGYFRNGKPIYVIAGGAEGDGGGEGGDGGDGSGDSGDGAGSGGQGGANNDTGQKGAQNGAKDEGGKGKPKGKDGKEFDPDRAQRTIDRLRNEHQSTKDEFAQFRKDQEDFRKGLAKLFGFEGEEITPEKLQEELKGEKSKVGNLESENRQLKLQLKVNTLAQTKNVPGELLFATLYTSGALDRIDLAADDVDDQVGGLIDKTLERLPQLRGVRGALRDAGHHDGTPPGEPQSVNDMIRNAAGRR